MPSRRRASSSKPTPRAARPPSDFAWAGPAARAIVALAAIALAVVAFTAHPIGDHYTESDFYDYALGGRAIARGHVDFGRYGVIGPVYEFVMAIPALVGLPAFPFGKALSILAATTTLVCWLEVFRRRLGPLAALAGVALIATNPVFFRYGYSTTTDLLAIALQSVSLWALLASRLPRRGWIAGGAAALATLTRYNAAYLVLGALLAWWTNAGEAPETKRRAALAWLAAFALIVVPWTALSVARGHWPGEELLSNARFYATDTARDRNVQDRPTTAEEPSGEGASTQNLPARLVTSVPSHLVRDARELLGWPAATLCALGVLALVVDPRRREWWSIGAQGALAFAALVPVFYSDRYSLAVLPFYASLGAVAASSPRLPSPRGIAWALPAVLLAWPIAASVRANIQVQQFVHSQLPRDVLEATPALRAERRPDDGVIARKGALAFRADARAVAFPKGATMPELGEYARENRARFLYYSWYEASLRSEFGYLLDTTTVIPGLTPIASVAEPPAVLYRIDPGFGAYPTWMGDSLESAVHMARGHVRVASDEEAWGAHALLVADAQRRGQWEEARAHAMGMIRGRPRDPDGWLLAGEADLMLGRTGDARVAFANAATLAPDSPEPRIGMGWAACLEERWAEAAAAWRPIIGVTGDPRLLDKMAEVFDRVGDAPAANAARQARAARAP